MPEIPRRTFLTIAAGALASVPASTYAHQNSRSSATQPAERHPLPERFPVKAIASANGLEATARAYELMTGGSDTLDAVVAGVTLVEDDPDDLTVGYGGLPNERGVVELDAAVMHGPTHRAGAVASLENIRNPARVAQLVMEQTDHVLLVGAGALEFACANGLSEENLLTEKARKIWLYWKQTLSEKDDWLPPPEEKIDPDVAEFFKLKIDKRSGGKSSTKTKPATDSGSKPRSSRADWNKFDRPTGTIHCAAMNGRGEISCVTTTSGLAFKLPGRVGDSPVIGAGLYVDNEIGSCGSTGRGEANLQNLCSFAAVELMRQGMSPKDAAIEVLKRVAAHTTAKHLLDDEGRPAFNLKFYVLAKDGTHAGAAMWGPTQFAVTDAQGSRLEDAVTLFEREKK